MTTIPSNADVTNQNEANFVGDTADTTVHSGTAAGTDATTQPHGATPNRAPTHDSTSFEKKKHNILGHLENLVSSVTGNKEKKAQGDQKIAESLEAVRGSK